MTDIETVTRDAEQAWLELWVRGPAETRWEELPPQVGDPAPDLTLTDSSGNRLALSETWGDRPALLLFWRHYGCGCGVDRAARLRDERQDYLSAGANVVVIGQADPERSAAYAAEHGIEGTVLCDPSYEAYHAFGLRDGQLSQLLFDAPEEFLGHSRAIGEQFMSSRRESGRPVVDHPWLLPGEFVVGTDGTLRLAYRYQYCEDFPDPRVLTTAIRAAAAGTS